MIGSCFDAILIFFDPDDGDDGRHGSGRWRGDGAREFPQRRGFAEFGWVPGSHGGIEGNTR